MVELRFSDTAPVFRSNRYGVIDGSTEVFVDIVCRNAGPTPAWIFQQSIRVKVTDQVIQSATPYPTPELSEPRTTFQKFHQIHSLTRDMEPIVSKANIWCNGWATKTNHLQTYIYGVVKYRDAFNSHRKTWFGYSLLNGEILERIPNEAYNQNL
jgi:hypothetical protein